MSDHHQHGALIARPPKDHSAFHGNAPDKRESAPGVAQAAPPAKASLFGRFLNNLFPRAPG
jgi:hypothetical protein